MKTWPDPGVKGYLKKKKKQLETRGKLQFIIIHLL